MPNNPILPILIPQGRRYGRFLSIRLLLVLSFFLVTNTAMAIPLSPLLTTAGVNEDEVLGLANFDGEVATSSISNLNGAASSESRHGFLRASAQSNSGSSAYASAFFKEDDTIRLNVAAPPHGQPAGYFLQYRVIVDGSLLAVDSEASAGVNVFISILERTESGAVPRSFTDFTHELTGDNGFASEAVDALVVTEPFRADPDSTYQLWAELSVNTNSDAKALFHNTLRFVGAIVTDEDGNTIEDFTLSSSTYDYKAGVAIPEPSAFVIGSLGMLCMACRRRFV